MSTTLDELVQHCQLPDEHVLDLIVTSDRFHEVSHSLSEWRRLAPILIDDAELAVEDIERDYNKEERKRSGFLAKWTQKLSMRATYRRLIEALLKIKRTGDALKICELFKGSADMPTQTRNSSPEPRLIPPSPSSVTEERDRALLVPKDLKVVRNFIWAAYTKWYHLGVELELDPSDLEAIRTKFNNDPAECFNQVLLDWLIGQGSACTWKNLATALKAPSVDFPALSEVIDNKYLVTGHEPDVALKGPTESGQSTVGENYAQHKEAYYEAIRKKIVLKIKLARLIHAGLPRSGKSSTIKRLMGEIYNLFKEGKVSISTGAAEYAGQIVIMPNDTRDISCDMATISSGDSGSSEWSKLKGFIKEDKMLSELLHQLTQRDSSQARDNDLNRKDIKREDIVEMMSPPLNTGTSKDLEQTHDKMFSSPDTDLENDIKILLNDLLILLINTDTGGQPEFLDMLSALIMGPSLYLLYHRLIDQLDEPFKISYTYPNGESTDENESTITTEETLFQVLSSIACCSNPCDIKDPIESSEESDKNMSKKYPICSRALFVGTHLDLIKSEELPGKQTSLKERVENMSFYKDGTLLFPNKKEPILAVDNYKGTDDDRKNTRKILEEVIESNFKRISIPAAWLILSLYMRKDINSRRIMSLNDCEKQALKLGIDPKELKDALWFLHHCMGLVL